MNIPWPIIVYLIWFAGLGLALVGTVVACVRHRLAGLLAGAGLLLGSLLMFGFVSGVVGFYEIPDYARSLPFGIGMGTGLAGLVLFCFGMKRAWSDH